MKTADRAAIRLCGRLEAAPRGRNVSQQLPGRQGRLLLAYLACKRGRPVTRDELIDVIWPSDPPALPDEVLGSLLSKVRRVLGPGVIEGRHDLTLVLPEAARVDVEIASDSIDHAEAALAAGEARVAFGQAKTACELTEGGFLPGFDNPWVEERRREVEELRLRALGCVAGAGLALGGAELASGERAARELISAAPLRELGYRLLMGTLAARGDVAAALQAYDSLRVQLRDELGIAPGPALRALHERLLAGDDQVDAPAGDPTARLQAPHREERKVVSALAVGCEDAQASDDPEDLRVTSARLLEGIRREVERFGGSLESRTDRVPVALFGATVAHEDDAERAVRAAVRLRELDLAAGAGVATGEALVAPDAPAGSVATGRAIEHAIRMQRGAPSGTVVADEVTVRATPPDAVVYDALDEGTWVVRAVSERLAAALEHPVRTRFLGRESELTLLESLHRRVVEHRRPSMVLILGNAGVGKSRLVDEFLKHVERSGPSAFRGRCLAYGEGTTYWALREVLWTATGIGFDDPAATAAQKLRDRVGSAVAAPEAARVTAALAIASGIALPDNPLAGLTPGSVAHEIALAWPAFLSALAASAPIMVVIEDLHWAEEPLLEILERLIDRSTGPLMLVSTARPELAERRAGWSTRLGVSQVSLDPLPDVVSRELISELLPQADAKTRDRVRATAEGNPFFAEELARHVSDKDPNLADIPNTVRAVLAARMDGLAEMEKQVLQDAAVVGRVFWAPTLEAIETREALPDALQTLEDRGLVVTRATSSLPGQTELSFRHGLTREVAYRSIPRARRCRAHAAVGRWVEQLAGDRRDEFIDLLAQHFEAAAQPADTDLAWPTDAMRRDKVRSKAVAALVEAGWAARQCCQTEQALAYAGRALRLARSDSERLTALELRASTLHAAVRADEALATYREAVELARRTAVPQLVSRLRADATLLCARYGGAFATDDWTAAAVKLVEQGIEEMGDDSVDFETAALLIGRMATPRWQGARLGDTSSARRDARRVLEIARAIDSPYLLAAGLHALYKVATEDGLGECAQLAERMVQAADQMRDRIEAHEAMVIASSSFRWAGQFDRAREVADRAITEAAAMSPHRRLHAIAAKAACLIAAGRMPELLRATAEVAELVREEGSRTCPYGAMALSGRALSLFEAEQVPEAASTFDLLLEATPRVRATAYFYWAAEVLRPFVNVDSIHSLAQRVKTLPTLDTADEASKLRLELQLNALSEPVKEDDDTVAQARLLADQASAPFLGWIADWAEAVALARAGARDEAARRAREATAALDAYGEPYQAARLLVDLLPLLDAGSRHGLAEDTGERLRRMGAFASAAEAFAVTSSAPGPLHRRHPITTGTSTASSPRAAPD